MSIEIREVGLGEKIPGNYRIYVNGQELVRIDVSSDGKSIGLYGLRKLTVEKQSDKEIHIAVAEP
jgi:hypothetical protein